MATRWTRVAAGDYETADGRYRCYQIPDLGVPGWNVEAVWTEEEFDSGVDLEVVGRDSELVVDGAASFRDAKLIFDENVTDYDRERREAARRADQRRQAAERIHHA